MTTYVAFVWGSMLVLPSAERGDDVDLFLVAVLLVLCVVAVMLAMIPARFA